MLYSIAAFDFRLTVEIKNIDLNSMKMKQNNTRTKIKVKIILGNQNNSRTL
jgi:hypothetical protein